MRFVVSWSISPENKKNSGVRWPTWSATCNAIGRRQVTSLRGMRPRVAARTSRCVRRSASSAAATWRRPRTAPRRRLAAFETCNKRCGQGGSGGPGEALGELRLEAQQVAETQRQVANEVRQLAESGDGSTRRRLADRETQLAARVETLGRAAGPGPADH